MALAGMATSSIRAPALRHTRRLCRPCWTTRWHTVAAVHEKTLPMHRVARWAQSIPALAEMAAIGLKLPSEFVPITYRSASKTVSRVSKPSDWNRNPATSSSNGATGLSPTSLLWLWMTSSKVLQKSCVASTLWTRRHGKSGYRSSSDIEARTTSISRS